MDKKLLYYLLLAVIIMAVLSGCGNAEESANEAEQVEQPEQTDQPEENAELEEQEEAATKNISVDINGTTISFDDIATDGALIVGDEMVIQTMIIKEDIPEEHVAKLAQEIANYLRGEYPDLIVTILAERVTGEELIHITLE